jgi:hypothetical protein
VKLRHARMVHLARRASLDQAHPRTHPTFTSTL